MPSRSPSYSPRDDSRIRKHKHKKSSRSGDRRSRRSRSRSPELSRHSKHKSSHHKHKRRRHSESDSEDERRQHNPERRGRGSRFERSDDEVERRHNDERRTQNYNKRKKERGGAKNPFQRDLSEGSMSYGRPSSQPEEETVVKDKEKPNFEVSGKLAEETNTYKGIVIKYSEPPEARKPKKRWRLYPFKGDEIMKVMHIHRQSAYLLGRDRRVADIPIDHPSCSKQHAVLQYRLVNYTRDNGTEGRRIRPYVIDLGAANGTFLNGKQIESQRYFELMEKDVLKFGFSTREYVVLTDKADTTEVEEPLEVEEEDDEDIDD